MVDAPLSQLPQDLELWRLQRDPAQHRRQGCAGPELMGESMSEHTFFLSEDHRIFRESLARFLAENWSLAEHRKQAEKDPGFSKQVWAKLAELGALGAFLPEKAGGMGGGGLELMIAMEALGRALFVSPYLWSVALAGPLLAASKKGEALLGDIAAGKAIVAVALTEPQSRYDLDHIETRARQEGGGYILSGEKRAVAFAGAADAIVVPAKLVDGIALFLVSAKAAGVTLKSYATADGARAGDLSLRDVKLAGDALLADPGKGLQQLQRAVDLAM